MPGFETVKVAVSGGTPGGDSNDYVLFDSTVCFGTAGLRSHDISRAEFGVQNSQTGTLKAYWSADKGTNWNLYNSTAVAIPAAGASSGPYDYLVDAYDDWKLVWTNGGSAQTTWRTSLTLIRNFRGAGT